MTTVNGAIYIANSFIDRDHHGSSIPGIKVVALLLEVKSSDNVRILNAVFAGDARPPHSHAEYLLCDAQLPETAEDTTVHIVTTKVPCAHCATKIIRTALQQDRQITIHMPHKIDIRSKWFESQIKGLKYLLEEERIIVHYV